MTKSSSYNINVSLMKLKTKSGYSGIDNKISSYYTNSFMCTVKIIKEKNEFALKILEY